MSFTSLTSILRSAWRRPKQPLVQLPQDTVKLYERVPPPWARWALVLVSVDVMVSCVCQPRNSLLFCPQFWSFVRCCFRTSAVDIVWNAWTMPDASVQDAEGNHVPPAVSRRTDTLWSKLQVIQPGHVLVPAWKRALSGSVFIFSGMLVAASILAARSRVVRCVSYARSSKETPGPSIYLQTASHSRTLGYSYPVKDCWLRPWNENQLMLEIKEQGKWVLDVRGAKIGNEVGWEDRTLGRSTMLKTWKAVNGAVR